MARDVPAGHWDLTGSPAPEAEALPEVETAGDLEDQLGPIVNSVWAALDLGRL